MRLTSIFIALLFLGWTFEVEARIPATSTFHSPPTQTSLLVHSKYSLSRANPTLSKLTRSQLMNESYLMGLVAFTLLAIPVAGLSVICAVGNIVFMNGLQQANWGLFGIVVFGAGIVVGALSLVFFGRDVRDFLVFSVLVGVEMAGLGLSIWNVVKGRERQQREPKQNSKSFQNPHSGKKLRVEF